MPNVITLAANTAVNIGPGVGGGATPFLVGRNCLAFNTVAGTALTPPVLSAPTTATTGGTLAAATYFYKATWTVNGGSSNESAVSNEISQVTTGATSTVTFAIGAAPAGASGLRIYRSTATGTETLLATLTTTPTSYTDTGALTPGATAMPGASNAVGTALQGSADNVTWTTAGFALGTSFTNVTGLPNYIRATAAGVQLVSGGN